MEVNEITRTRERVKEHYEEVLEKFQKNNIVGIFLQGSQNYGLEIPESDVDTKLIITPSFKDIALNSKPISTTYVRANQEHIDFKDIRLYIDTFRSQNLNFLEILFTDFFSINPLYANEWNRLLDAREAITHMNPVRAVRSMCGMASEKFHAMKHPYPSKIHLIEKYGYDGKQVSHLIRIEDFMERYIAGESYQACLYPTASKYDEIIAYKKNEIPLEKAEARAEDVYLHCDKMKEDFKAIHEAVEDPVMYELLRDVQYEIMKLSVVHEIVGG